MPLIWGQYITMICSTQNEAFQQIYTSCFIYWQSTPPPPSRSLIWGHRSLPPQPEAYLNETCNRLHNQSSYYSYKIIKVDKSDLAR